jgi:hypothetical protein
MSKRSAITGGIALGISVAVNVPRELERHHHASRYVSVQVFAAVGAIVFFAVVLWLVFFAIEVLIERCKGAGHDSTQSRSSGQ